MKQKRIEWIDIARGIAIICMVMGHSTIPQSLSKYIWSFHMPLFFLISGLFYSPGKVKTFQNLLCRKIHTLVIPYWFFTFIVFVAYYGTEYFKPNELYEGWTGYALWFVPVLFIAELIFYPISRLKYPIIVILILILTGLGYVFSIYSIKFPFKLDCVPFAIFFIGCGFVGKRYILPPPKLFYVISIGIVTIVLSQVLPKLDMCKNDFGLILPNLFNALIGTYFIFCVAKYLAFKIEFLPIKFICYLGKNSLFVMAFSQVYNYWILRCLNSLGFVGIIGLTLRYILLFLFISLTASFLTKYTPFFVGKQGSPK